MKISYIKSAFFALTAAGMLASCSNDSNEPINPEAEFEGIYLNIPNNSFSTRAEGDETPSDAEGKINKLTVIAYQKDNNGDYNMLSPIEINSFSTGFNPGVLSDYQSVPVKLGAGNYKLYVFANLSASDIKVDNNAISTSTSEDDLLKNGQFSFTVTHTPGDNGLPMSCKHADLKVYDNTVGTSDIAIQKGKATSVKADLTLCVAKLRVTVLNNTTPTLFMNEQTQATLTNSLSTIGLYTAPTGLTPDATAKTLGGGKYFNYPKNGDEEVDPATWTVTDFDAEDAQTTRPAHYAWQGVWYVPEHLFASNAEAKKDDMSTVNVRFNYSDNDQETVINGDSNTDADYTTAAGVVRSNYYDHLYYVSEKKVTVKVKVKAWGYHKYNYDLE